jgi:hypothetical protein
LSETAKALGRRGLRLLYLTDTVQPIHDGSALLVKEAFFGLARTRE